MSEGPLGGPRPLASQRIVIELVPADVDSVAKQFDTGRQKGFEANVPDADRVELTPQGTFEINIPDDSFPVIALDAARGFLDDQGVEVDINQSKVTCV